MHGQEIENGIHNVFMRFITYVDKILQKPYQVTQDARTNLCDAR